MESRSSRNMAVIAAAAATLAAAAVAIPANDGVPQQDSTAGIATSDHMVIATPDHMVIATPDHMF